MGQEGKTQMEAAMGVYDNDEVQTYVSELGLKIAANAERPHLPWSFTVVDDPIVNAFALPGGPVFVSRGILTHMNSEAELVSVLGHEVGHITAKHTVRRISNAQVANLGLGIGSILAGDYGRDVAQIGGASLQILFLSYGRGDESQSDDLGFRYMQELGYDVREMPAMFRILQRVSGPSAIPEWQSTHPDPGNRIAVTEARIAALPPGSLDGTRVGRDRFLDMIEGMPFGEDPRQGYMDGNTFIHPALGFRMDAPPDWSVQNSPQSVIVFPETKDAYLQMTMVGQEAPTVLAAKFYADENIGGGPAESVRIHGLDASVGDFRARTENGMIYGRAAFIWHGGNTYGLFGLADKGGYNKYRSVFESVIASFQNESRQEKLEVEPDRIRLVRLEKAMSLADFQKAYPSTVSLDQLAIINGIDDSSTRIPAGTRLKRVAR